MIVQKPPCLEREEDVLAFAEYAGDPLAYDGIGEDGKILASRAARTYRLAAQVPVQPLGLAFYLWPFRHMLILCARRGVHGRPTAGQATQGRTPRRGNVGDTMTDTEEDGASREQRIRELLRELLASQRLAVLATHQEGQPYCSLVGIAASDDLTSLLFATKRATRKFRNLATDDRVALMLDSRAKASSDFQGAVAVTAMGRVGEVSKEDSSGFLTRYLDTHPDLRDFVLAPNCALLRVRVEKYVVVQHFQEVTELEL